MVQDRVYVVASSMDINQDILLGDIFSYLAPKDMFSLRRVSKAFFELISNSVICSEVIKRINKRLGTIFGDTYGEFKKALQYEGAHISGSFILQCALDEYWQGDIDIYCNKGVLAEKNEKVVSNALNEYWQENIDYNGILAKEKEQVAPNALDKFFKKHKYDNITPYVTNYRGTSIIGNIASYHTLGSPVIQIIRIDSDNIKDFINSTFDLNMCKNMFWTEKNNDMIQFYNLANIFNRETTVDINNLSMKLVERCRKYEGRGITIHKPTAEQVMQRYSSGFNMFTIKKISDVAIVHDHYTDYFGYEYKIISGDGSSLMETPVLTYKGWYISIV